jgi:hypothetical protein
MSNNDLNDLIEEALSVQAANDAFKEHLLQDSTTAFVRGRALQRQLRMTGLTLVILLVTAATFVCGRLSVSSPVINQQVAVRTVDEGDEHIKVSKDLVVWLDAARFFTRLGMDERAALSYQQASDLIPYDALPESQQAGIRAQNLWAAASEGLSIPGGQLHETIEQTCSAVVLNNHKRESGCPIEILSQITTQHFWRSEP